MKKRLLSALLCVLCGGIWLFPYDQLQPRDLVLVFGALAAVLCLTLIPRRAAALGVAGAIALGITIFDVRFLAGMAPGVFVAALAAAADAAGPDVPLKKDGLALVSLFGAAGTLFFSLIYTFATKGAFSFTFDRAWVWLCAAAAIAVFLFVNTLRAKPASGKKGRSSRIPEIPAALYASLFLCLIAGALLSLKLIGGVRLWTYSAFLAAAAAFTVPGAVTRGVFNRKEI